MLNDEQRAAVKSLIKNTGDKCIFPYFKNLHKSDISFKESKSDPVSIADKEAELLLNKGLLSILPNSLFIGEELFERKPEILNYLNQQDIPVWVVDPIDGTNNFISGQDGFGIMVCLVFYGEIISSWFYEICTKKLTIFHKGNDVTINGEILKTSSPCKKPFTGQIGKKLYQYPEAQKIKNTSLDGKIDPAKQPSIITYHKILTGELDFLIFKITYPWDHLPGIALLSESGAVFNRWSGKSFQFSDIYEGLVVARNQEVMELALEEIIAPLSKSKEIMNIKSFKA